MYPLPGAITTPGTEVVEHDAPRRQVVGQHPPGAPSAQHVADGVDDLPTRVGDGSAARFGRWQQWFQQLPFSVAEVAGIGWSFHAPTLRPTPLSRLDTSTPISTFLDTLLDADGIGGGAAASNNDGNPAYGFGGNIQAAGTDVPISYSHPGVKGDRKQKVDGMRIAPTRPSRSQ